MKLSTKLFTAIAAIGLFAPAIVSAEEKKADKPTPYPLKTCIVSDEKLGGDHGEPYVFVHEGKEIKLCCKPCLKDFKKDTAKYLKKIEDADKKAKKS